MALVFIDEDEDKPGILQGQSGEQSLEQPGGGGPGLLVGGGSETPQTASPEASPEQPSGMFKGIGQFLAANKPQTEVLANRVSGLIGEKGNQARAALSTAGKNFENRVGSNEVGTDQSLLSQIGTNPAGFTPQQISQVQRMRDAQYGGPKSIEETDFYAPAEKAVREATQLGEQTQTPGGIRNVLAQLRPGQRTSAGRLTLDQSLLAANPESRQILGTARAGLSDLPTSLQKTSASAKERAGQAASTTAGTQQATRSALSSARTGMESDLESRLGQAKTAAQARKEAAQRELANARAFQYEKGGQLSEADAARFGITKDQLEQALENFNVYSDVNVGNLKGKYQQGRGLKKTIYAAPNAEGISDQTLADAGITREELDNYLALGGSANARKLENYEKPLAGGQPNEGLFTREYQLGLGDLSSFLRQQDPEAAITRANLATPEDYARLAALNQLSGEQNLFLNPDEANQAGSANLDLTDLPKEEIDRLVKSLLEEASSSSSRQRAVNSQDGGDHFLGVGKINPI